ncbi:hypothetical protein K457DRAFT_13923 [Linnemannia elongata AG-77]|uniref:F-box domain-containing protein n=1 Tax=Linnemannia elongata AG-77 TaxID=1314771 RepID=A0A197KC01_9FUNG|nr:hypothetical protein K457DRAFT_13923 [Linnemannia elongata AG-77]
MAHDDLSVHKDHHAIGHMQDPCLQREHINMNKAILPPTTTLNLSTLPPEIIFCVMRMLGPREILTLALVNSRIRLLSAAQLSYAYDMKIRPNHNQVVDVNSGSKGLPLPGPMSEYELYVRMVLSELYSQESKDLESTSGKDEVKLALSCCKRILRRLYLIDKHENFSTSPCGHITNHGSHPMDSPDSSPTLPKPIPFVSSTENLHIVTRVLADQVCRGICLPETAVLVLQSLTSLWDQDQFQYLINSSEKHATIQAPPIANRLSIGQLCFQYLIPNVLGLLKPVLQLSSSFRGTIEGRQHGEQLPEVQSLHLPQRQIHAQIIPPPHPTAPQDNTPSNSILSYFDRTKSLTSSVLPSQQELLQPPKIRSIAQLTRVLVFLPLLGRHFNTLPTSTFIETFLDRSKGDLPIDRAAVMVYGFMCVLDLEAGKTNLSSDSYKIFERSMPTQGVVQAQEMVRIVSRYRLLMRGFLLSSPTFSSTRMFGQNNSS